MYHMNNSPKHLIKVFFSLNHIVTQKLGNLCNQIGYIFIIFNHYYFAPN